MIKRTNRGFTLIELLVVISIIGLMSSVTLTALQSARMKARDAKKIREFSEIQKALTLYYDANGRYPIAPQLLGGFVVNAYTESSSFSNSWNSTLSPLLTTPGYIPTLPTDTSASKIALNPYTIWGRDSGYTYASNTTGSQYQLFTRFEASNSLSCSNKSYRATFNYPGNVWVGQFPNGTSFCSGTFAASNANLYVVSSN